MAYRKEPIPLTLASPCFLGGADQKGTWRTPPIKALLREWWRVAAARGQTYDHRKLRQTEGKLFGNAWLDADFSKSQVRLALAEWSAGKMTKLDDDQKIAHPETTFRVGSQLYLGYGPLTQDKGTALKNGAALQAGEPNSLALSWPDAANDEIIHTLQLIDWFGTMGGRNRNGWGSLTLGRDALTINHPLLKSVLRPLKDCLELDWPHAIGQDEQGPLIWESADTFSDWQNAMRFLAQTKIGYRTHFTFNGGKPHRQPDERHVLAYPVTNHDVAPWGRDARLPNQLRFKLIPTGKQLRARIYHTPCKSVLPMPNINQCQVWQTLHHWLDTPAHGLRRLKD